MYRDIQHIKTTNYWEPKDIGIYETDEALSGREWGNLRKYSKERAPARREKNKPGTMGSDINGIEGSWGLAKVLQEGKK